MCDPHERRTQPARSGSPHSARCDVCALSLRPAHAAAERRHATKRMPRRLSRQPTKTVVKMAAHGSGVCYRRVAGSALGCLPSPHAMVTRPHAATTRAEPIAHPTPAGGGAGGQKTKGTLRDGPRAHTFIKRHATAQFGSHAATARTDLITATHSDSCARRVDASHAHW